MNLERYSTTELTTREIKEITGGFAWGIFIAAFVIGILFGVGTAIAPHEN